MLLSWSTAAVAASCLVVLSGILRPLRSPRARLVASVAWETAVVLALYALWQKAGDFAVTHATGAVSHAMWVWRAERTAHLPRELSVQHLVLPYPSVVRALNVFYAVVHVPALIVFLIWLYFRHRDAYPHWRNVGALLTGACLLIQMIPVAPPRLLPQLGFVDTAVRYGESVYGPNGIRIAPQLAAMPSVHVGWAVFIAVVVIAVSDSRWRWLVVLHPALTVLAVVATANHWWLDGIVASALLPLAMVVEGAVVAGARRVHARSKVPAVEPALVAADADL